MRTAQRSRMGQRLKGNRGFTLLELIVLTGVLAVAAALMLSAVSSVRGRMGDVGCQNNLRQLLSALEMYNVDHHGSMPYGFFFVGSIPPTWDPPDPSNRVFISWASELNRYFGSTSGYA